MEDLVIKETKGKGRGVFTNRNFKKGEQIAILEGSIISNRTEYSVQVGPDKHIDPTSDEWRFTNHSCDPNCGIKINSNKKPYLCAMRDISKGEEITWDYAMSEHEFTWKMPCHCGNDNCRKLIDGYRYLDAKTRKKYKGFVMPYLEEKN